MPSVRRKKEKGMEGRSRKGEREGEGNSGREREKKCTRESEGEP